MTKHTLRILVAFTLIFLGDWAFAAEPAATSAPVKLTIEPGHPWTAPFGLERVGRPLEAVVEVPAGAKSTDEYVVVGYRDGNEVSRQVVKFIMASPYSPLPNRFGRVALERWPSDVALWVKTEGQAEPAEAARAAVKPPAFEAEAVARPDTVINPVELGMILPPSDWLLLAGGQKAEVEVVALSRGADVAGIRVSAWYASASDQKVQASLTLSQERRAQVKLVMHPCSTTLKQDRLHVAIVDDAGKEIWRKDIRVMLAPEPPEWPRFGAVATKLRYDLPIPVRGGQPINYEEGWDPKLQDVVVCLPNGARFVFWRGSSYIPFWAGKFNTGFCYECAERLPPTLPPGINEGMDALWDGELRYGRVAILESTPARVRVRWTYVPRDPRGIICGDSVVEDFCFYPDGFGIRAVTLTMDPVANYELNELTIITPQSTYPFAVLPPNLLDMIYPDGAKAQFHFPCFPEEQKEEFARLKNPGMPIYRVRIDKADRQCAIQFCPWGGNPVPPGFGCFYDHGALVTPVYWGSHWPLTRNWGGTPYAINDHVHNSPAHNSIITAATNRPKPIRTEMLWSRDAVEQLRPMKREQWAWLIGMTEAGDDELRQWAQSFTHPPTLQVQGAQLDAPSYYAPDRRALCLTRVGESQTVELTLTSAGWCVNPVFELKAAPKSLRSVHLNSRALGPDQYRWNGATLWILAKIEGPATLKLEFGDSPIAQ